MKLRDIIEPLEKLLDDAYEAEKLLNETDTQFSRRAYIRSIFSLTEGSIWLMKQTCLKAKSPDGNRRISIAEYAMLADESYDLKDNGETSVQTKFLRLPDNLRFTVKILNRLFNSQLDLEVGTVKWDNVKKAIKIRNRITHPRNAAEIDISDDEIKLCREFNEWFNDLVHKFILSLNPPPAVLNAVEDKTAEQKQ